MKFTLFWLTIVVFADVCRASPIADRVRKLSEDQGQAVNIRIRSEGCNDPDKTPDTCGIAYIYVNDVDKSPHSRGHNVVVLDGATGAFLDARGFDTHGDSNAGVNLRDYLNSITGDKIVLVAIQDEGSLRVAAAIDALKRLGATEPILTDYRGSFALVGYAGDTTPAWITQEQRNSAQGPSEVTLQIPLSPIPVDGGWSNWGDFGECSVTCGDGTKQRSRTCTNPPPSDGGADCPGPSTEIDDCINDPCVIDGGWSDFGDWSECSLTCGGGIRERRRTCTNPPPSNGGECCTGDNQEVERCNTEPCEEEKVDGGWSKWSAFGECSKTCGKGKKTRTRTCTNPPPSGGGKKCKGKNTKKRKCNLGKCKGHGYGK